MRILIPKLNLIKMEELLDTLIRYKCVGRDVRVTRFRIKQTVCDQLYQEGLRRWQVIYTDSFFEGLPDDVCNDILMGWRYTHPGQSFC